MFHLQDRDRGIGWFSEGDVVLFDNLSPRETRLQSFTDMRVSCFFDNLSPRSGYYPTSILYIYMCFHEHS